MKVSIIIPTYEHFDFARRAIDSALSHTPDCRVQLIDDASKSWKEQKWDYSPTLVHRNGFSKNGGLTRSWNHGLRQAQDWGAEYTVCTNSDVLFTPGWFKGIEQALNNGADLVGPLTNAPGHRPKQQVLRHIPDFKLSDDPSYLMEVAQKLEKKNFGSFTPHIINGFCMIAKTSVWWANAFDKDHVFNPKFKMTKNEDELQGRWTKRKKVIAIVPSSFVFHYRGVTRRATSGKEGHGWYRPKKKS